MRARLADKTAATAATAGHAVAALWNPATAYRLEVTEVHFFAVVAGAYEISLRRSTTRGTAGSSVTSSIVNDVDRQIAPPSGAILDKAAYTAQPTLEANELAHAALPSAIGAGVIWTFPDGISVPAGNGLVLVTVTGVATTLAVAFAWTEH